ncbi:hypothetical protein IP69_09460 [Bosea sp. AAP35]|uniref:hypothetical protein n=1 Tax=Bosea sp. AAP35 TaxID=1523417 RepID=UPI0006B92F74|nr:hypothetical protein [Bosea sp. AAP35]KPF70731.1 hypothetical protein IP69_09460 [Bosea sp. AAP35]
MQTTISSRELDRRTGAVKKTARNGPVFITKQGRTSHVLITIEAYRALAAADLSLAHDDRDGHRRDPHEVG